MTSSKNWKKAMLRQNFHFPLSWFMSYSRNKIFDIRDLSFVFIGYSLLHWAACWGHLELVKYLVDANINIFLRNKNDETATEMAERNIKTDCVSYLKKAGECDIVVLT